MYTTLSFTPPRRLVGRWRGDRNSMALEHLEFQPRIGDIRLPKMT